MDEDSLFHRTGKRVVCIQIKPSASGGETIYQSGIIVECENDFAYVIADARQLVGKIGVSEITIEFPDKQQLDPLQEHFHVENGLVGILCYGSFDTDLVKEIEFYDQPLRMSQDVYVYEGVFKSITDGKITLFHGDHFSHNCAVPYLSEHGAPVVAKDGKLVGMCDSGGCHLTARIIFSLLGTIESVRAALGI